MNEVTLTKVTELDKLLFAVDLAQKHAESFRTEFDVPADMWIEDDNYAYDAIHKVGEYIVKHRDQFGVIKKAVMILPGDVFVCVDWKPDDQA